MDTKDMPNDASPYPQDKAGLAPAVKTVKVLDSQGPDSKTIDQDAAITSSDDGEADEPAEGSRAEEADNRNGTQTTPSPHVPDTRSFDL